MAIGWGDWGLRLVDQATSNADLGSVRDGLVRVPEVDPRYEAVQRRQEARKLKSSMRGRREEAARKKKFSGVLNPRLIDEANQDVLSQYAAVKRDSQALNRAFSSIGAPVRSYQNFSNNSRPVYDWPYSEDHDMDWESAKYVNEHPGAYWKTGTLVNSPYLGEQDANRARSAGHFVSREPYDMAGDLGYYKVLANPFDMKSVPSKGLWAKGEWATQNPELAAKRWLPPAFKNAIWGR